MVNDTQGSAGWHPPLYIITAEQGAGKTSFILEILGGLEKKNLHIRGIVAPGYFHEGTRSGFSLINLATGESQELCSSVPSPEGIRYGRFYFRPEGLNFGYQALDPLRPGDTDLLVIDEVGIFELKGEVWSRCIDHHARMACLPMIWTVRRSLVDAVTKQWPVQRSVIVELGSVTKEAFIGELLEEVRIYRTVVRSPVS